MSGFEQRATYWIGYLFLENCLKKAHAQLFCPGIKCHNYLLWMHAKGNGIFYSYVLTLQSLELGHLKNKNKATFSSTFPKLLQPSNKAKHMKSPGKCTVMQLFSRSWWNAVWEKLRFCTICLSCMDTNAKNTVCITLCMHSTNKGWPRLNE